MPWNDLNVARLRELWDQGLPTAQIGKLLEFTKNAVVGKAHRIGLERRPSPIRRTAVKPDRKKARSPMMPKLNFENDEIVNNGMVFLPHQNNLSINIENKKNFVSFIQFLESIIYGLFFNLDFAENFVSRVESTTPDNSRIQL